MLPNAFIGQPAEPTDGELAAALGPAKKLWDQLLATLGREHSLTTREWHSYSRKAGWALRVKREDRNILYMSPCRGRFFVSVALGDKAVQAALESGLPAPVLGIIKESKRYAEGTGVRIEIEGPGDLPVISKLTAIKLDTKAKAPRSR